MKKIKLYIKILIALLKKNVVSNLEYGESYDKASITYDRWINLMGKHVKPLICAEWFNEESRVIDLACGTGFISRELIGNGYKGKITGIDISNDMLKKCSHLENDRIQFYKGDAVEYLEKSILNKEVVDGIFLGWAYPYMNQKRLHRAVNKILKPGGYFVLISNCSGTLRHIEKSILNVMAEHIELVDKPMEARIKLPSDEAELKNRIEKSGFKCIKSGSGEELKSFDNPNDLYDWLMETGALAGVDKVFKDIKKAKPLLIEQLRNNNRYGDEFGVNHKFVYGVFQKSGGI